MTTAAQAEAPAFVVIHPDGRHEFRSVREENVVDHLVGDGTGHEARALPTLLDTSLDERRLRIWAGSAMLLFPERFAVNEAARELIDYLSHGAVRQTWRGSVALVEYDRDPQTGELGFTQAMTETRREQITAFLEAR